MMYMLAGMGMCIEGIIPVEQYSNVPMDNGIHQTDPVTSSRSTAKVGHDSKEHNVTIIIIQIEAGLPLPGHPVAEPGEGGEGDKT